jgi:hypothetical protein
LFEAAARCNSINQQPGFLQLASLQNVIMNTPKSGKETDVWNEEAALLSVHIPPQQHRPVKFWPPFCRETVVSVFLT